MNNPSNSEHIFFSSRNLPFLSIHNPPPVPDQSATIEEVDNICQEYEIEDEDLWLYPEEITSNTTSYKSWDEIDNYHHDKFVTPYITEAGSAIFDAAVEAPEDYLDIANDEYLLIDSGIYLSSLRALGLGRNSKIYTWDEEKHKFRPVIPKLRISGYTGYTLIGHLSIFIECGNITKSLQRYVVKCYSGETSPCQVALANSVSILLSTLQLHLGKNAPQQDSIIRLQIIFKPVHSILNCFQQLINNTTANRSDESLLSTIFENIQILEHRTDSLRKILLEILVRVSQPWLRFASEWLGLKPETGLPISKKSKGKSLVRVESEERTKFNGIEDTEPNYMLDLDRIPSFIAPDDARTIFEVGSSLRFLKAHHPNHFLARADYISLNSPPQLEWNFSYQDISQVEKKAMQYEGDLKIAIQKASKNPFKAKSSNQKQHESKSKFTGLSLFKTAIEDMQSYVSSTMSLFDKSLPDQLAEDNLSNCIKTYLTLSEGSEEWKDSLFAPPISLVPALSFNPIVNAQARIINGACMKLFFTSHNLRVHLSIQKDFQLFGNGVFASRLTHAIFDQELNNAKYDQGIVPSGNILGLRLDGRNSWPPASSELRLALMGILVESYTDSHLKSKIKSADILTQKSLPGDLSFAVREMSESEIDSCLNPDGLEALDFLRLSYQPPAPLNTIITPVILFKYDQIFKFLLRIIRMLYVVSSLFRKAKGQNFGWGRRDYTAQRFRIEAHHFVCNVSSYFFDTGINATWRIFEAKLDRIENYIFANEDLNLGHNEGLDKLRDYHELVVDRIMSVLFLHKRQQPVLHLLEEIFGLILQFSKWARGKPPDYPDHSEEELNEIYYLFRKKKGIFMTVLKGMGEKKGSSDNHRPDDKYSYCSGIFARHDLGEQSTEAQLLTRLEISAHYKMLNRSK